MSEYQYYEFAAIDRPLTRTEMAELRAVSSRAVITPVSFINHYEWGDLKANPDDWMRQYFDGFVYSANWCTCHLSLRVPKTAFRKAELASFANEFSLLISNGGAHWIIDWVLDESEDHERFTTDDGSGWMRRLAPLRDELLRGDRRPLYLGWLAGAVALAEDVLEPEVPPGLSTLSTAQQALVEFLEVDPDLLEAARAGSPPAPSADRNEAPHIAGWLDTWQARDMKDVLKRIALGQGQEAERLVKSRYAAWLNAQHPSSSPTSPRRRVAELNELARSAATVRRERETRTRAEQEAKRQQEHEAYLRVLMARAEKQWKAADTQARRGGASGYEQVVHMLSELAEGYALVSSREAFDRELQRFLVPHVRRAALLRRLADAGLGSG